MDSRPLLKDRKDAGHQLAALLDAYRNEDPVVLGLPRGGIVVASEIASELDAPLDVVVARKLGAPSQPELGIGAVAPDGIILLDQNAIQAMGITEDQVDEIAATERAEMRRRLRNYRGEDQEVDVRGRTVILVDDGLATGVTALAAIRAVRHMEPKQIVLAVGVCAAQTAEALQGEVDDLVCVAAPEPFRSVGQWYEHFEQTTDEEVIELLAKARAAEAGRV